MGDIHETCEFVTAEKILLLPAPVWPYRRGIADVWQIRIEPLDNLAAGQSAWGLSRSGEYMGIPLIPYRGEPGRSPHEFIFGMMRVAVRYAGEHFKDAVAMHWIISTLEGSQPTDDRFRMWVGFAVQLK